MNRAGAKNMRSEVMALLRSATRSIMLEQAYFSDTEILEMLIEKSRQNVEITIVLPKHPEMHNNANMVMVDSLLKTDAKQKPKIYMYPTMIHGKVILVDQKSLLIGSTNLITSSLDDMGEVCVLLQGEPRKVLRYMRDTIVNDCLKSKRIRSLPYRPLIRRLLGLLKL